MLGSVFWYPFCEFSKLQRALDVRFLDPAWGVCYRISNPAHFIQASRYVLLRKIAARAGQGLSEQSWRVHAVPDGLPGRQRAGSRVWRPLLTREPIRRRHSQHLSSPGQVAHIDCGAR